MTDTPGVMQANIADDNTVTIHLDIRDRYQRDTAVKILEDILKSVRAMVLHDNCAECGQQLTAAELAVCRLCNVCLAMDHLDNWALKKYPERRP